MKYDDVLKVRLESSMKKKLKGIYGKGMSEYVRSLIIKDMAIGTDEEKPCNTSGNVIKVWLEDKNGNVVNLFPDE
jgi:hypothetical protein